MEKTISLIFPSSQRHKHMNHAHQLVGSILCRTKIKLKPVNISFNMNPTARSLGIRNVQPACKAEQQNTINVVDR
ncbi:hypothetical protein VTN49DRAFT_2272 [Thermomyces lanuginosus]|uniref:uncharacterized protein n=1 Tax=Thermomyces lanuginosus TaxID=5541 RepID=UPI003742F2B1